MKSYRPLWAAVLVFALLSPLGWYLPQRFQAGSAWGEWTPGELHGMLGYVPAAIQQLGAFWSAPLAAYDWPGSGSTPLARALGYAASALIGVGACAGATYLLTRWVTRGR